MTEQRKAVIKNADMSEDMQQDAVDCASQALSKYNIEKVRFRSKIVLFYFTLVVCFDILYFLAEHSISSFSVIPRNLICFGKAKGLDVLSFFVTVYWPSYKMVDSINSSYDDWLCN